LAQALINDPDLVILDEPTAGLDPIGCREVKDLIITLKKRGKTVLLSSHLLSDVEDVCDRVVIYYGGKIQALGTLNELLAKRDSVRITTPALPPQTMQRVLEIIRHDAAADAVQVDNPRQNLESYFLEVVRNARASAETSGAISGNRVAAYLRGDAEKTADNKQKILEQLTAREVKPVEPAPAPVPAEPAVDQVKLASLAKPVAPEPAPAAKPVEPAAAPADLSKANEKLSSLLGNKKQ
jgi:ABC-2 type transport system ATP-binding protein